VERLWGVLQDRLISELRLVAASTSQPGSSAARLVKQFPALLDAIANGELHLTGLLMIGPHLTPENQVEVLGRAKFRTKKELAKLVRELNPLPRMPDLIEPLSPAPLVLPTTRPSWAKFVASWEGPVRVLPDGERPGDWANDGDDDSAAPSMPSDAPARCEVSPVETQTDALEVVALRVDPSAKFDEQLAVPPAGLSPAPRELPPITGPQQYQMQFSTSEKHVQLVERAKALLARSKPGMTLGELHLEGHAIVGGEPREAKVRGHGAAAKACNFGTDDTAGAFAIGTWSGARRR
jgi:hypothetical protein